MQQPSSQIPVRLTLASGVLFCTFALWVNILAQSPTGVFDATKDIFGWFLTAGGFISLAVAIGYGFLKKQKYENIKTKAEEWQGLAESKDARIKDLKFQHEEALARYTLQLANGELQLRSRETKIEALETSNIALVAQNLQMKAILKGLRLEGKWHGDEDRLHITEG